MRFAAVTPGEIAYRREPLPSLPELEREWLTLEAAGEPSFFTSWAWIGTMLDSIPAENRPLLLRGRVKGETVALALIGAKLARRRRGLVRARGLYLNETGDAQFDAMTIEHNGLLTSAAVEAPAMDALLGWFAGLGGEVDELHLAGSLRRFPASSLARHGLLCRRAAAPSYSIELARLAPGDGDLDPVLSGNARQQLRRAVRHFAAQGSLRLDEAASEREAQRWFGAMKTLHSASWERRGRRHSFTYPFFEPFHRRLIERCFAAGAVQMIETRAGARVIGYLYNFRRGGRIYAYQSGFDDADPRERPGYVSHALAIRHAFRQGMETYDFMAGRNRLKESFSTRREAMLWQIVQQPRLIFRLEHFAQRLRDRVAARNLPLAPSEIEG